MNKQYMGIGLVVVLILAAAYLVWSHGLGGAPIPTPSAEVTYTNATSNNIVVDLPEPGAVVSKQFSVRGKARGTWFFEASFPVQLIAADGTVLVSGPAQAEGDWMTEDFVPFNIDLTVPGSYTGPATLVLHKDNPSGLPEHEASISFPITVGD